MAVRLAPIWVGHQFFTNSGIPLSGGKINTYTAGTTTPQSTFTDSTGATPNANPIILDSTGKYSAQIWLTTGVSYKFVLTDSANNVILTEDNLIGINDNAGAGVSEWVSSVPVPTYVSGTSFTISGNVTATYVNGVRIKATLNSGSVYSTVSSSSFGGGVTTVTVVNDSTALDNTLSAIAYGFLGETNPSVPANLAVYGVPSTLSGLRIGTSALQPTFHAHLVGAQTSGSTVIFGTVDNQNGSGYSNSTGVYTVPAGAGGWHYFSASISATNSSGGNASNGIKITANAVDVAFAGNNAQPTGTTSFYTVSTVVNLAAGQTVSIGPSSGSAWTATVGIASNGSGNSFSGHLMY